ncbi:hypothetical protein BFW38_16100 [Terasakiispira papahanaumokuakeensis]|uniref:Uncharacterized protein n=1 Tax=Terasakiispira papahanaumokuakeensis TaxID=197479 RepID=A0A1E2VD02_9GAMM|nr:DUF6447 family protein [Terasakiispira papahanaumokuakeensis]ODC04823.1 hypothetical protein BFW38_16100 [Terasakiispira papahanaumokuakeensis]
MAEAQAQTVKINGQEYALDALSDTARQQLNNLRFTDAEIQRLQAQLAIAQTARSAYAQSLQAELDAQGEEKAAPKKTTARKTTTRKTTARKTPAKKS